MVAGRQEQGNSRRIFIFGIDSATFDLILPLVKKGKLPTFQKLMQEGAWGTLLSTHPFMTPPAWTTFMTGRRPENHGVFNFRTNEMIGPKYKRKFISSTNIQSHTIFKILDFHRKKSLVIGLPMTYPPFEINGALVSGFMTPGEQSQFTYPKDLKAELLVRFGDYILDPQSHDFEKFVEAEFIKKTFSPDQSKLRATAFLMDRHVDWDFCSVVFSSLDHIQHYFWKYIDPLHPEYNSEKAEIFGKTIEYFHVRYDEYLRQFLGCLTPDDTVIIVSDHGAGPLRAMCNIDHWLEKNGYLRKNRRVALKNRGKAIYRGIVRFIRSSLRLSVEEKKKLNDRVLYRKTRAFVGDQTEMGIYLNEKGRKPRGIVNPGREYCALRDELVSALKEIREPNSGEYIFEWVRPREELYDGRFSDLAPDILFKTRPGYLVVPKPSKHLFDYNPKTSGMHEPEGIFIAHGPAVKKNFQFDSAHILDMAPTFLYLMGLPVDQDMDGRVLEEVVREDYRLNHPPEFMKYSDILSWDQGNESYSETEQLAIKKKLEGLGYL